MSDHHLSMTLLEELVKTVQEKGPEAVIVLLRNSRTNFTNDADIQFVIVSVCKQLNVDIHVLINEQVHDDMVYYAKAFIVYYLRDPFDVEWKIIKQVLRHKDQSHLWRLMNNVKTLKENLAGHKVFYDHKVALDQAINTYKQKK